MGLIYLMYYKTVFFFKCKHQCGIWVARISAVCLFDGKSTENWRVQSGFEGWGTSGPQKAGHKSISR